MSTSVQNQQKSISHMSVFDNFRVLVFCSQFQLFLLLHVAVSSHRTQVASIDCQQHHRGRKRPIADVSQPLPRHHGDDPEGNKQEVKAGSPAQCCTAGWKVTVLIY